jgi:hypothetical protein
LDVKAEPDWRTSQVQAWVYTGENDLEGRIAECVNGTVVYIVGTDIVGKEKYKLTRWDDRTFCWTPAKETKKNYTQLEVTWTACE